MTRLLALAAVLVLVMAVSGCAAGGSASTSPIPTSAVDLPPSYRFTPVAITVPVGTTVTWTNRDNFTHNVTFPDLPGASVDLPRGGSGQLTLSAAGTHRYLCSLHPQDMRGEVVVTGS